jgi:predicted RNA-binding Zn ribbon-like protein
VLFAHDTQVALAAAAALVNTGRAGREDLPDIAALDRFAERWEWTGERAHDQAELEAVRTLRPRLALLWHVDEDAAADLVNTLLREGNARPQLVKHGDWNYHIHATRPDVPLADRMAVEAAMAVADVIRSQQLDRLRLCAADDCDAVHVDLSKNRSRRFCSQSCANRVNVAAYRSRLAHRRETSRAVAAPPAPPIPGRAPPVPDVPPGSSPPTGGRGRARRSSCTGTLASGWPLAAGDTMTS